MESDYMPEACSCEQIKEILLEMVERGKRAPSQYNIFMGECIREKTGAIQERLRACALEWRQKKAV